MNKKPTLLQKIRGAIQDPQAAIARKCEKFLDKYRGASYDFHKNGEYELLAKLTKINVNTVFDVGSNVGDWAITANSLYPNAKIHCFELSESTFQTLSKRLTGSAYIPNNYGMSDVSGTFEYKDYGSDSKVNTLLLNAQYHDSHTKANRKIGKIISGVDYCKQNNIEKIDLLKIDVEGAEHLVLKGFSEMLEQKRVRVIQFEYGYTNGDAKFLMRDFFEFLGQYGYIIGRVRKAPIEFTGWTYKHNDFNSGPNYVAVHKDDSEVISILSK